MPFYRKKPVVVEAFLLTPSATDEIAAWCGGKVVALTHEGAVQGVQIPTLEGVMLAAPGDYVIRGVKGEFYPCKPHIFEATYDDAGFAGFDG